MKVLKIKDYKYQMKIKTKMEIINNYYKKKW